MVKNQYQIVNYDILKKASLLMIILIIPMSYVHETGHAIICSLEENEFHLAVGINGGSLVCLGGLENKILFYAFGGLFATLVALAPLVNFRWMKKNSWALIVSLSLAMGYGVNAIVEIVFNNWYLQQTIEPLILLNGVSISVYFLLLLYFGRKNE